MTQNKTRAERIDRLLVQCLRFQPQSSTRTELACILPSSRVTGDLDSVRFKAHDGQVFRTSMVSRLVLEFTPT